MWCIALREIHERAGAVRRQRFRAMAAEGVKYTEKRQKEGVNSTESGLQFRVINRVKAQFRHVPTAFVFITPVN